MPIFGLRDNGGRRPAISRSPASIALWAATPADVGKDPRAWATLIRSVADEAISSANVRRIKSVAYEEMCAIRGGAEYVSQQQQTNAAAAQQVVLLIRRLKAVTELKKS